MSFSHRLQEGRLTGKGCSASRREPLHRLIMKSINLEVCASVLLWHPIGHGAACVLVESLLKLFLGGIVVPVRQPLWRLWWWDVVSRRIDHVMGFLWCTLTAVTGKRRSGSVQIIEMVKVPTPQSKNTRLQVKVCKYTQQNVHKCQ